MSFDALYCSPLEDCNNTVKINLVLKPNLMGIWSSTSYIDSEKNKRHDLKICTICPKCFEILGFYEQKMPIPSYNLYFFSFFALSRFFKIFPPKLKRNTVELQYRRGTYLFVFCSQNQPSLKIFRTF